MKSDREMLNSQPLVNKLINEYQNIYNVFPTFEDLLKDCIRLRGLTATEFLVSTLYKGWLQNDGKEIDFTLLRNKYFGYDRIDLYEKLESVEFDSFPESKVTNNDNPISPDGTLFDKYVWEILEDTYSKQYILSGFITDVSKSGYEVTFNLEDILFIPENIDLEYNQIKGFVPKEKYKYFDNLTIEQFKNIEYYVKILFIEKSSKTLILKPSNYEK